MITAAQILKIVIWPACTLIFLMFGVYIFRQQISDMFPRVRTGEIEISKKGFRLEFEQDLTYQISQLDDLQTDTKTIVDQAAKSKDKAIVLAWNLLSRRLKRILAESNWGNGQFTDVRTSITLLVNLGVIPNNTSSSLNVLENERDRIVKYQGEEKPSSAEGAIIAGIQILRVLYALSPQQNIVEYAGLKIYKDSSCKEQVSGVTGVMIRSVLIDKVGPPRYAVFPTTRTDYEKGERLTWKWDLSRGFGEAWYRDPNTNEIKKAWDSSALFIGGNIDTID